VFGALLKKQPLAGICAIDSNSAGISIARITHQLDNPVLEQCDFYPAAADSSLQLNQLTVQHQLDAYKCVSLLNREGYQLLMMDAPPVPKEEMKLALRWRIKDLIDTPVTDITLDAFDVPPPRGSANSSSVYVVAAKNDTLHRHSEKLTDANINLQIIDIMELAQRNIANLLADNDNGVALLSLQPGNGLITLSKAGKLYLSRPINIELEQALPTASAITETQDTNNNELFDPELELHLDIDLSLDNQIDSTVAYDHVALELQRSLDYYESNFRQTPIRKLYLAPTLRELPGFSKYIKDNLNIEVELLDLNNLFHSETKIPWEIQAHAFFAIGAALHRIDDEPGN